MLASHIVLISEWDTLYGRSLSATFEHYLKGYADRLDPSEEYNTIHRFSYLRGIDGKLPKSMDPSANADDGDNHAVERENTHELERPVGRARLDYARRLVKRIQDLDRDLMERRTDEEDPVQKGDGKRGVEANGRPRWEKVRAIGVLGSDPFDKELILQALRPAFTNVFFFTNDLDARLIHPDDYRWNRNLMVTSSFGLELHPSLQRDIPPFRDGYQTSIFLAVQMAVPVQRAFLNQSVKGMSPGDHHGVPTQAGMDAYLSPRVFEVQRNGAFDLSLPPRASRAGSCIDSGGPQQGGCLDTIYPRGDPFLPPPRTQRLTLWILAAAGVLFALSSDRFQSHILRLGPWLWERKWRLAVAVVLLGLIILVYWRVRCAIVQEGRGGEPFSFSSGISAWPGILLRYAAVVLTLYFLGRIHWLLRADDRRVRTWVADYRRGCATEDSTRREAHQEDGRWVDALLGRVSRWWRDDFSIMWWHSDWAREDLAADRVCEEYLVHGRPLWRWLRVAALFAVFVALTLFIYSVSKPPHFPVRGFIAADVASVAFLSSFLLLSLLTFYVVDATRLCRHYIDLISRAHMDCFVPSGVGHRHTQPTETPTSLNETMRDQGKETPALVEQRAHWRRIELIAQGTSAVAGMILYPFTVIFLILLSRLSFFDNWDIPASVVLIYAVIAAYALSCAFSLRKGAENARQHALYALKDALADVYEEPKPRTRVADQIKLIIERIEEIRYGAFLPWSQQPAIKALLIPFGSGVVVTLVEYWLWAG
jgi:hypothetical protein